jgi:sporulation protein YqfC
LPKSSRRQGPHPRRDLKNLFAQPPKMLYGRASLYWCGREMEIENFQKILDYDTGYLKIGLKGGSITVTGDELSLTALEKGRALLRGRFFKIEFSYE